MGEREVVVADRDGIEHVVPIPVLPLPVLATVDAKLRVPTDERFDDFGLPSPAIVEEGAAHSFRRIARERYAVRTRHPAEQSTEGGQASQQTTRPIRNVFDDQN